MGVAMPRRYKRVRREDPEKAHDMAELVKKLRARKKRMRKHAHEGEVANIFEGQSFSDEDVPMGSRNTGWKTIKKETSKTPSGMVIEKTTRIRRFGRMKKTAFLKGFVDELEKLGIDLSKLAAGVLSKMVIEPTPKKSSLLKKNPFLRIESKRRLVSGKGRTESSVPKAKGLLSGSVQFAHLTQRKKEAS